MNRNERVSEKNKRKQKLASNQSLPYFRGLSDKILRIETMKNNSETGTIDHDLSI